MRAHRLKFGRYDFANFSCFGAYAACSVAIPMVLVSLAHDLHFPLAAGGMAAGGALQLGRSIPMVAAMLLSGFAAGRFGKLHSLGGATLLMSLGIMLAAFAPGYLPLFAAICLAGFGEGVVEGLATPVIQDLHPDEPGRYINFTHAFWSVGVVGAVLAAGALLAWGVNWRWVLAGCSLLTLIPALIYLLPSKNRLPAERKSVKAVFGHAAEAMRLPRFWLYFVAMFLAGGGEFCLTFWAASFIQLDFHASAWLAGVGTAFFAGGMILGRMGSGVLVSQRRLPLLVLLCAAAGTLFGVFPLFLTNLALLFAVFFALGIVTGPFWPSLQSHCVNRLGGAADATMLYILLSCAGVPGCGVFTWLMGVAGNCYGLRASFVLVPLCFAGVGFLVFLDEWLHRPERRRAAE